LCANFDATESYEDSENIYATLVIDDSETVRIEPDVTIIVGQNESGKTAFLQALHKAFPVKKNITYNVTEEYPRKG
ncbi:AAA family ATPase, partial [Paenibacillus algorifonticola]|uniref:AAA family ATPase n=1 Tax=Paenibacillus algorifonticola TaxID=684063 RepID=UPI0018CF56E4